MTDVAEMMAATKTRGYHAQRFHEGLHGGSLQIEGTPPEVVRSREFAFAAAPQDRVQREKSTKGAKDLDGTSTAFGRRTSEIGRRVHSRILKDA